MDRDVRPLRRVVTGDDEQGRSKVLFDSAAPNAPGWMTPRGPGMTEMWCFDAMPATIAGSEDRGQPPFHQHAPDNGGYLRIVEYPGAPPGYDHANDPDAVPPHAPKWDEHGTFGDRGGRAAGRSPIHATRTVDYGTVLQGQMALVLDESETVIDKGTTVVQLGDFHQWVTLKPGAMSFVMIDATFDD